MPPNSVVGRRVKLHDLHVLATVAQAGSMRKAAAVLNTSQPSISRSIAELESAVGVRLLDRNPQGIVPTTYGRALLDGGEAMFEALHQAVKNIEFLADPEAGEVRIGSIIPIAASFVSTVVDQLARRYPRIVFRFVTGGTEALHGDLHAGNVDLLIARRYSPATDEQENFEFLFEDSYVVVAGAKNPWTRRRGLKLADLVNEFVGLAGIGKSRVVRRGRNLSRERARVSARNRPRRSSRGAYEPAGERALSLALSGHRLAISDQASGAESCARRTGIGAGSNRHCHPDK